MSRFDAEDFSRNLLAEMLFYEENFGLIGTISLVDAEAGRERYLASFDPDEGAFLLEKATEWAPMEVEEPAYEMAIEGTVVQTYSSAQDLAGALFAQASDENLRPHLQILYEDIG